MADRIEWPLDNRAQLLTCRSQSFTWFYQADA